MSGFSSTTMYDQVVEYRDRLSARERRRRLARIGFATLVMVIGSVLRLWPAPSGGGLAGEIGLLLFFAGILTLLVPELVGAWRRERGRGAAIPPRRGAVDDDLVPYVDHEEVARFLRRVASYGADDWRGFVSAARARGVLDTPVYLPLVRNPGERRGSEEAVADPRRLTAVAHARSHTAAILGESVAAGVVPFAPPYDEYHVTFTCVLALLTMEGSGRDAATPPEQFARAVVACGAREMG